MSRPINMSDTLTFVPTSIVSTTNMSISGSYPESNGYTDASSNTYTRFSVTRNQVGSTYYVFSVTGIPSGATISSVSCVAKIRVNNTSNVTNTGIQLYSGTTAKGTSETFNSTSTSNTVTLNGGNWIVSELENARLYFNGTGAGGQNQSRYIYFYGATLTISYLLQGTEYEITSTIATDIVDSISPSGSNYIMGGNNYELNIYASSIDDIIVEDNGNDVTEQLVQHAVPLSGNSSIVLGEYTLVSGSFNGSGATFFQGIVGKGEDASTTTSNYYSGGSGTIAVFNYDLTFNDIPSNATITRLYIRVNGHAESTSQGSEYMCAQLVIGDTTISDELNFKSIGTSNSTQTIEATTLPTVAQLSNLKLKCRLGYYGGAINGATCYVEYSLPNTGSNYYWTYTLTNVQADHNIEIGDADTGTRYLINTLIRTNNCSVNESSIKKKEGTDFTLIIYYSNINNLIITDNGNNINSLITGSSGNYNYALTNIIADHTIIINEKPWYQATIESLYENATVSISSNKIYEGESFTATVNVSNISLVVIKDNGIDVTSQFTRVSTGVYRASYSNVNDDHEIIVVEANSYTINSVSNTNNATISPSGVSSASENSSMTFKITTDLSSDLLILKDNGTDVTSSLTYIQGTTPTSDTGTFIPSSFDSTNSTYNGIYNSYNPENGLSAHTETSTRACVYSNTGANAESYLYYSFNCSQIPANATITSVTCIASAACYSNGSYFSTRELQLCYGTTPKGTSTTVTGNGNTPANHNINGGSWTREELNDIKIRFKVVRSTSNSTDDASFSFWGATLTVNYEVGNNGYYQYTLSNINEDHTVALYEVFIPEEEDPQKTYYSVSVSSINATTNPANGTIRVEEGDDQTIVIIPSESNITLATDNGVDITNRLVGGESTYDVTTQVSGASYGFNLNSSTGYYVSTNNGVNNSASVARINFHMKTRCLVTIEYINYAEASYDYGMFGKIDTAVATDGLTAGSGSSSPSDSTSNYQLAMASNSASPQTITYTIESGEHFIDIKYGKDDATNSNNDSLQWKISSIESLESTDLTYTINNIDEDHSLIFVFGNVVYYTVNTTGEGCTTYPTGNAVVLPNNGYSITIIPAYDKYEFEIYDNGRDVSKSAEFFETERAKYYLYTVKKVNTDHIISVIFTEKSTYIITSTGYQDMTISPSSAEVYEGESYTVVINTSNIIAVVLYDNNVNVTSNIINDNGTYKYTISNISTDHSLRIEEFTNYTLTATSNFNQVTITPSSVKVYDGQSTSFTITAQDNHYKLFDNDIDVTSSIVSNIYTINNVHEIHTLIIEEQTKYEITAAGYQNTTISPSSTYVYEGESITFTISNFNNNFYLFDNNINVTSNIQSQGNLTHTYEINNVQETHSIRIESKPKYSITVTQYNKITGTPSSTQVYEGESITITLNNFNNNFYIFDNNVNVTSSVVSYTTYTINNVHEIHNITFEQKPQYNITLINNVGGGSSLTALPYRYINEGESSTIEIVGRITSNLSYFIEQYSVLDNGIDIASQFTEVTGSGTSKIQYILNNITTDHTIILKSKTLPVYIKINNQYSAVSAIYQKSNGVWINYSQTDYTQLFDTNKIYILK